MTQRTTDHRIAIVGCGPAGLSAAIALHDAGYQVTLFERFEEPQPVGSGLMLQPTGLAVLQWLGCRNQAEQLGQRIDGMLGKIANTEKVVLDVRYAALSKDMYGVAIHRAALFQVLYEAVISREIELISGVEIADLKHDAKHVSLIQADGNGLPESFDLVVDASGRNSPLLNYSDSKPALKMLEYGALWGTVRLGSHGFDERMLEQRYQAASVMAGVLPCGRLAGQNASLATFFWSIKSSEYDQTVAAGIDALKRRIVQIWPEVDPLVQQIKSFNQLVHARYSHHTLKKPYERNVVFIGDAAHATSPQLGQGANMALLDVRALTAALTNASSIEDALKTYARLRRLHVRLFQLASLSLTPLYQSDSRVLPALRDTFFQPVSRLPFAARLMTSLGAGLMTRPVEKIESYDKTMRGK